MEDRQNSCPVSETPVTRLSRILSKASSNSNIQVSQSSSLKRSQYTQKNTVPQSAPPLEREHSLGSRIWLTRRHKRRRWPRISGISRKFANNIMGSSFDDTNSCPAAIFSSCTEAYNTPEVQMPLPNHKVSTKQSEENTPLLFDCSSNDAQLSKCQNRSMIDKLFSPVAKRRRTESASSSDQLSVCENQNHCLDDTVPIEVENTESVPSDTEDKSLNFLRLHSTPTLSKRPLVLKSVTPLVRPTRHSFSGTKQAESKVGFSRCISVPIQSIETALSTSKVDNHHSSMLCDDSWASATRPRALPVIDRTSSGLHCISIDVIGELVRDSQRKKYKTFRNVQHVIIDCRFPYEYEGGHIKGAINIFTHSDLVQEIFNRVPAQRPPGAAGPPKLLGDGLARRLAATMKEPLSAPCELASPENDNELNYGCEEDESWIGEEVEEEQTGSADHIERSSSGSSCCSINADTEQPTTVSESDRSSGSSRKSCSSGTSNSTVELSVASGHDHPAFVRLCCPKQYVKMFHRDYREHLRLYRRLTKRVSSACLACIRPQNRVLVSSGNPPPEADEEASDCAMEPIFGLDFSGNTTFGLRPPLLPSPCSAEKRGTRASGPLSRFRSQASGVKRAPTLDYESDKENVAIGPSDNTFELMGNISAGALNNTAPHETNYNLQIFLQSPADQRLSSVSPFHDKTAGSDSPLSVAEAVVRAGHRVMAATLTSAAPSAEVVEALDIFHRRAALPIPVGLKRSSTVMGMFQESSQNMGVRKRPASNSTRDFLPLSNLENLKTPMAGRLKRANTLGCQLSLEVMQKETNDALTAGTPILNIACQNRKPVDSPTVDYGVFSRVSP